MRFKSFVFVGLPLLFLGFFAFPRPASAANYAVYTNTDYKGTSKSFSGDVPNLGAYGLSNNISSIDVGWSTLGLYTGTNYTGDCFATYYSIADLRTIKLGTRSSFDNNISSIKDGGCLAAPPTPTPKPGSPNPSTPPPTPQPLPSLPTLTGLHIVDGSVTESSIGIAWNSVPGAESYEVLYTYPLPSTQSGVSAQASPVTPVSGTSYTMTGLPSETNIYNISVRAVAKGKNSSSSDRILSQYTASKKVNKPSVVFSLSCPAANPGCDLSSQVLGQTYKLTATVSDADGAANISQVRFSTNKAKPDGSLEPKWTPVYVQNRDAAHPGPVYTTEWTVPKDYQLTDEYWIGAGATDQQGNVAPLDSASKMRLRLKAPQAPSYQRPPILYADALSATSIGLYWPNGPGSADEFLVEITAPGYDVKTSVKGVQGMTFYPFPSLKPGVKYCSTVSSFLKGVDINIVSTVNCVTTPKSSSLNFKAVEVENDVRTTIRLSWNSEAIPANMSVLPVKFAAPNDYLYLYKGGVNVSGSGVGTDSWDIGDQVYYRNTNGDYDPNVGLDGGTKYCFVATVAPGTSSQACVTTKSKPPIVVVPPVVLKAPTGLKVTPTGPTSLKITWDSGSGYPTFNLEVKKGSNSLGTYSASGANELQVNGLEPSTHYTVTITGVTKLFAASDTATASGDTASPYRLVVSPFPPSDSQPTTITLTHDNPAYLNSIEGVIYTLRQDTGWADSINGSPTLSSPPFKAVASNIYGTALKGDKFRINANIKMKGSTYFDADINSDWFVYGASAPKVVNPIVSFTDPVQDDLLKTSPQDTGMHLGMSFKGIADNAIPTVVSILTADSKLVLTSNLTTSPSAVDPVDKATISKREATFTLANLLEGHKKYTGDTAACITSSAKTCQYQAVLKTADASGKEVRTTRTFKVKWGDPPATPVPATISFTDKTPADASSITLGATVIVEGKVTSAKAPTSASLAWKDTTNNTSDAFVCGQSTTVGVSCVQNGSTYTWTLKPTIKGNREYSIASKVDGQDVKTSSRTLKLLEAATPTPTPTPKPTPTPTPTPSPKPTPTPNTNACKQALSTPSVCGSIVKVGGTTPLESASVTLAGVINPNQLAHTTSGKNGAYVIKIDKSKLTGSQLTLTVSLAGYRGAQIPLTIADIDNGKDVGAIALEPLPASPSPSNPTATPAPATCGKWQVQKEGQDSVLNVALPGSTKITVKSGHTGKEYTVRLSDKNKTICSDAPQLAVGDSFTVTSKQFTAVFAGTQSSGKATVSLSEPTKTYTVPSTGTLVILVKDTQSIAEVQGKVLDSAGEEIKAIAPSFITLTAKKTGKTYTTGYRVDRGNQKGLFSIKVPAGDQYQITVAGMAGKKNFPEGSGSSTYYPQFNQGTNDVGTLVVQSPQLASNINIFVHDQTGKPVANAKAEVVKADESTGQKAVTTVTNSKGRASVITGKIQKDSKIDLNIAPKEVAPKTFPDILAGGLTVNQDLLNSLEDILKNYPQLKNDPRVQDLINKLGLINGLKDLAKNGPQAGLKPSEIDLVTDSKVVCQGCTSYTQDLINRTTELIKSLSDPNNQTVEGIRKIVNTVNFLMGAKDQYPQAVRFFVSKQNNVWIIGPYDYKASVTVTKTTGYDFIIVGGEFESITTAMRLINDNSSYKIGMVYSGALGGLSSDTGGNMRYFDYVESSTPTKEQKQLFDEAFHSNDYHVIPDGASASLADFLSKKYPNITLIPTATLNSLVVEKDATKVKSITTQEGQKLVATKSYIDSDPDSVIAEKLNMKMIADQDAIPDMAYGVVIDILNLSGNINTFKNNFAKAMTNGSIDGALGYPAGTTTAMCKEANTKKNKADNWKRLNESCVAFSGANNSFYSGSSSAPSSGYGLNKLADGFDVYMGIKELKIDASLAKVNAERIATGFNVALHPDAASIASATFNSISYSLDDTYMQDQGGLKNGSDPNMVMIRKDLSDFETYLRKITGLSNLKVGYTDDLYVRRPSRIFQTKQPLGIPNLAIDGKCTSSDFIYQNDIRGADQRKPLVQAIMKINEALFKIYKKSDLICGRIFYSQTETEYSNFYVFGKSAGMQPELVGWGRIIQHLSGVGALLADHIAKGGGSFPKLPGSIPQLHDPDGTLTATLTGLETGRDVITPDGSLDKNDVHLIDQAANLIYTQYDKDLKIYLAELNSDRKPIRLVSIAGDLTDLSVNVLFKNGQL